jgi:hypothetical protein
MELLVSLVLLILGTFLTVIIISRVEKFFDKRVKSIEVYHDHLSDLWLGISRYISVKQFVAGILILLGIILFSFFYKVDFNPLKFLIFLLDHIVIFVLVAIVLVFVLIIIKNITPRGGAQI